MTTQTTPQNSSSTETLVFAFRLDGKGGGQEIGWPELDRPTADSKTVWMHLNYESDETQEWLYQKSGLDEIVCNALLAADPRPRSFAHANGLLVILRGVNMNPGAEPDDMVSLRVWLEPNRIITLRYRRIMAVNDLREATHEHKGPKDVNEFLVKLIENLIWRIEEVVTSLDEQVDDLEEKVITEQANTIRIEISQLRRMAISLRRYIAPQRQAMNRLVTEEVEWFTELTRAHLREFSDLLTRYVEDLDSARERASVTQEELNGRISERMNQTMYLISIFTVIFLPLGLLTGLLGINVGGMPGVESPSAFWIVCTLLTIMSGVLVVLLKIKKWF